MNDVCLIMTGWQLLQRRPCREVTIVLVLKHLTIMAEPDPYIVQPVLSELYDSLDLLDFDAPGGDNFVCRS